MVRTEGTKLNMNHDSSELNKIAEGQNWTDPLLATIFKRLMEEYPEESLRQHVIRALIMQFEEKYKPEMRRHDKQMQRKRENLKNSMAADKEQDMRLAFGIPETLYARIVKAFEYLKELGKLPHNEPDFMSDEAIKLLGEVTWFAKSFPRYLVPETY